MIMTPFLEKKGWLDYLYYKVGKQQCDFFLQYSDKEKDIHSKWKKYSEVCFDFQDKKNEWFIKQANHRQILPNEVVLDIEEAERLDEIHEELERLGCTYYTYETGSRGYHIHLYVEEHLSEHKKLALIKHFKADEQKSYHKTLIALENTPHWKSGKIKKLVKTNGD